MISNIPIKIGRVSLLILFLFFSVGLAQTAPEMERSQEFEKKALTDYRAKNFGSFLQNMINADQLRPNHPRLIYNLGIAYALNGKKDKAFAQLERLARMGLFYPIERDEDYKSLFTMTRFNPLLKAFEFNKMPLGQSVLAFSIPEKELIAESVAFNPKTKKFYVGSIHLRKILVIDENLQISEFSSEEDGLRSVLGMKVDEDRQHLWVCTTPFPQMRGFDPETEKYSGVFKYDLTSGRLLKKYLVSNEPRKHAFGDLVLAKNGDVYITDSLSPQIYRIDAGADELEVFIEDEYFASLQGITFSPDEKFLFIADYSKGISRIDMITKDIRQLIPAQNVTALGLDGLYYFKGDLIGIQNGVNPNRVIRFFLNKKQTRIEGYQTLAANHPDFNEPTLGLIHRDTFFFVANSQWNLVNEKGETDKEKLKNPIILKLKL